MTSQAQTRSCATLYLVDGHSHLYKAFYGVRRLATSTGFPTNAIFGFIQMLNRLIESRQPDYLAIVFDYPGPTFRSEIYPAYKANRPAQPEDLTAQIPRVKEIIEAMRITMLEQAGYEADDLIATLAEHGRREGLHVWICTSDKDLLQLVGPDVHVLRMEPDREWELGTDDVRKRMGVTPEQIPDFLGLTGDSSDNIPGVQGVGEKTAAAVLAQFPTIEAVYENLGRLSNPRFQRLLEGRRDEALLSKKLATVRRDLALPVEFEHLRRKPPDTARLRTIYSELEFRSLLERQTPAEQESGDLLGATVAISERQTDYRVLGDEAALRQFVAQIRPGQWLALDTETSAVNPMVADLVGVSLSVEPNAAFYIPVGHTLPSLRQMTLGRVRAILGPVLADPAIPKTGQNLKYDMKILGRHGMRLEGIAFDTLLASYLLDPDRPSHNLKTLARERLGIAMTGIEELIGRRGKQQVSMAEVEIERVAPYACADADIALQLTRLFERELREQGLDRLLGEVELPLMAVLNRMEMAGVRIDTGHFAGLARELDGRRESLAREIYEIAGKSFNLNSPRQVADVLFKDLGLKPVRQGKTGYSTDVDTLEQLSREGNVLPQKMLEYRMIEKLKTTYVEPLVEMINPKTGRIHTNFNQAVAATGRLSSSEPNLQNIPIRTEEGRKIRQGFIPLEDGHVLMAADYSQIELRVLAHFTRDQALVEAFRTGRDIHRQTASRVFDCRPEDVTPPMRDQAKVVNFGIIYGMSAHGLATQLGISRGAARQFMDDYFAAFPGVEVWKKETLATARDKGYVTTLLGRRRRIANINSRNRNLREAADRVAINTPIQGTAADLIKVAMIAVDGRLRKMGCRAQMVMQVHDELIFDLPEDEVEAVGRVVSEEMVRAMALEVPLSVNIKVGRNWGEC